MAKGPEAFRTISEASREIGVAQHVLRFWETRFTFVRPTKRADGRRFYRPRDIATLVTLKRLLHDEGHSIKEVQALYRTHRFVIQPDTPFEPDDAPASEPDHRGLRTVLAALEAAKARLETVLAAQG